MKKIISLFKRNYETDHKVRNEVVEGAEWVIAGEGIATRKFDGTCCMIKEGKLYKRYDCKEGKVPPFGFIPAQEPDPISKHWPGWLEVSDNDKWHKEAFKGNEVDGTYELCGPKIQGNKEGYPKHTLILHGSVILDNVPRNFEGIKNYLNSNNYEGIVWHHPDGRMVKIKKKDF